MKIKRERDLYALNEELIRYISDLIETKNDRKDKEVWQNPSAWKRVLHNLRNISAHYTDDLVGLAKVGLGLSKHLDFYSTEWMNETEKDILAQLVDEISSISYRIIDLQSFGSSLPPFSCGNHEDQACIIQRLGRRCSPEDVDSDGWDILPAKDAVCFENTPNNITLSCDSILFRIVDELNSPSGSWWIKDCLPTNKKKWRANYAVLSEWNRDSFFVKYSPSENINVWAGIAASQQITGEQCILRGGHEQIWISPRILNSLNINIQRQPFPKKI